MPLTSLNTANTGLSAQLSRSQEEASLSVSRLSSGNRIVRAADDVSGLSVATRLLTRITSLHSASRNIAQSISLLQVADGGLRNVNEALQRMQALTVQASSGTLNLHDRNYLDIEFQNLKQEIDRILEHTTFNRRKLFRDTTEVTASAALFTPVNLDGLALWLDGADSSKITLTYSTDSVATTASGISGTNIITTAADVSAALQPGARIRLGAAGNITTADTMGADTYTIASINGTVITTTQPLTTTYLPGTSFYRGLVSQWNDKSGLANHASQATAANMPLWVDDGLNDGAMLSFDGNNDLISTTAINLTATSAVTDFTVFNYTGSPALFSDYMISEFSTNFVGVQDGFIQAIGNNDGGFFGYWSGVNGNVGVNDEGQTVLNSGAWHLATTTLDKSQPATNESNIYINADNSSVNWTFGGSDNTNAFGNHSVYIGSRANGALPLHGAIPEKILYDSALSADARALVEHYQSAKWGLPLAPTGEVAEAPGIYSDGYTVSRFEKEGTLVGDVREALGNVPLRYGITGGNESKIFRINSTTGEIEIASPEALAASSEESFTLTVEADLGGSEPISLDVTISVVGDFDFQVGEASFNLLRINIGSLALGEVLSDPSLSLLTQEAAQQAFDVVAEGIDFITGRQAYVGSRQKQADIIASAVSNQLLNQDAARAAIADTDIAATSTEYAQQQLHSDITIAIAAQAEQLRSEAVLDMINNAVI